MIIGVFGCGYVGLTSGVCLASLGHSIICCDVDIDKIEALKRCESPIFEKGLNPLLVDVVNSGLLEFTTDTQYIINKAEVIIIAVGTPCHENGEADLKYVFEVAANIGRYIQSYKLVVTKSTVPVGTGKMIKSIITDFINERNESIEFDIVSNPEFLREGRAIEDFNQPERIVIGFENERALAIMKEVYFKHISAGVEFVYSNVETAELIKYGCNAFLAMKVSYINELSHLCEKVGANIKQVADAMGSDSRIGRKFLDAGPGYGGSCFPKDVRALVSIGKRFDCEMLFGEATLKANERQKEWVFSKIMKEFDSLSGRTICVLGLTFKADTNDMREAVSIDLIRNLVTQGAYINAYDPLGIDTAMTVFNLQKNSISYCNSMNQAIEGADAIVLLTEWEEFKNIDLNSVKGMLKNPVIFDFRNLYKREYAESMGFSYYGIGT